MKGSEAKMTAFMEGADKRFVIPVYQRKYDWKNENCRQLYDDLKKIVLDKRSSHFFGSIVSAVVPNANVIEYHIIDGQQRLTTITLLLLAMRNLIVQGKVLIPIKQLDEQISQRFLVSQWAPDDDKIKLRPVKNDRDALAKLFGDEKDYDLASNLTINYQFFCEVLAKEEIPIADLFSAIGKLEIICITLDSSDNAQLIFESLNSTGLALTEGDKIRNFILMGHPINKQTQFYDKYWTKIEKCTNNNVSGFFRDYLSIKQQITPTIDKIYPCFKNYSQSISQPIDVLLDDCLNYARIFEKLLTCKSNLNERRLDDCLYRLSRLEIAVTRPFLMSVLLLQQDGKITTDDVLQIFLITENFLFRRNICNVPTNALNKIFLTLNREIYRYDNSNNNYVAKFIYALLNKKESGRFPDDEEFRIALAQKQVYLMRGKYKDYLFERFENFGTVETKDVYTHLDNNVYTVEHIMPQHLTHAWEESLGNNAKEIHTEWLHRLANLTLTGYNPKLSNKSFIEKRDSEEGGYRVSGLKMNQKIATQSTWGLPELEQRNDEMLDLATHIWKYPETSFVPAIQEFDSCSLDDEDINLTGRNIVKYRYLTEESPATSWSEMFLSMINFLHQTDKSILIGIALDSRNDSALTTYISNDESKLRMSSKIDDNVFVEMNTSTSMKISVLRRIFELFSADPMDLVFYLKDADNYKATEERSLNLRKRYWEHALPLIQKRHIIRNCFNNRIPTTSNKISGYFGINGIHVTCMASDENASVTVYLDSSDTKINKDSFDLLFAHKDEIEQKIGTALEWNRNDSHTISFISLVINNVSIYKETDWASISDFHTNWSDRISDAILPYFMDEKKLWVMNISGWFRQWAIGQSNISLNRALCNQAFTRFTTPTMSQILPDLQNSPSGWKTDNHYFYEILNKNGKNAYIQLSISSQNITDEFRSICDKINEFYPTKNKTNKDWKWRIPFISSALELSEDLSKEAVFEFLDSCMIEIKAFEKELTTKLIK